jgi:hypothetical protein
MLRRGVPVLTSEFRFILSATPGTADATLGLFIASLSDLKALLKAIRSLPSADALVSD